MLQYLHAELEITLSRRNVRTYLVLKRGVIVKVVLLVFDSLAFIPSMFAISRHLARTSRLCLSELLVYQVADRPLWLANLVRIDRHWEQKGQDIISA
jgi:hypothetical protein